MDRQARKLANQREDESDAGSENGSGNSDSDFEQGKENGVSYCLPAYIMPMGSRDNHFRW